MKNYIVTISRQFGSGGSNVAKILSGRLNIPFYDKEVLEKTAAKSGISIDYLEQNDERKIKSSFLFSIASASALNPNMRLDDIITSDSLFLHTANTIKVLAQNPCVIVGRCADDILTQSNVIKVFIYADFPDRVNRICKRLAFEQKNAMQLIKKTDKKRANYYNFYTGKTWGDAQNYHLCINSSFLSTEKIADIIQNYCEAFDPIK